MRNLKARKSTCDSIITMRSFTGTYREVVEDHTIHRHEEHGGKEEVCESIITMRSFTGAYREVVEDHRHEEQEGEEEDVRHSMKRSQAVLLIKKVVLVEFAQHHRHHTKERPLVGVEAILKYGT